MPGWNSALDALFRALLRAREGGRGVPRGRARPAALVVRGRVRGGIAMWLWLPGAARNGRRSLSALGVARCRPGVGPRTRWAGPCCSVGLALAAGCGLHLGAERVRCRAAPRAAGDRHARCAHRAGRISRRQGGHPPDAGASGGALPRVSASRLPRDDAAPALAPGARVRVRARHAAAAADGAARRPRFRARCLVRAARRRSGERSAVAILSAGGERRARPAPRPARRAHPRALARAQRGDRRRASPTATRPGSATRMPTRCAARG